MELSPTESLLSAPGDNYSSLFSAASPNSATSPNTVNPLEMMTPKSTADVDGSVPETPGKDGDKKPAKKRKSWGQVLPEPKTNLPPRKRAKTEDEKEQRRVERVLRNRRAAQSSRERKRLEVEALEIRNQELETLLRSAQKANLLLIEELDKFRRDSGVVTRTSSPLDSLRAEANITLSPELFKATSDEAAPAATVNPASISPALAPVPDAAPQQPEAQPAKASATPDVTQHPAVSHVGERANELSGLVASAQDAAPFSLGDCFSMPTAADTDRFVLESGLLSSPNSSVVDDDYLARDAAPSFTHQPDFELFDINDFLNDEATHVASDIMAASHFAAADHSFDLSVHDAESQVY